MKILKTAGVVALSLLLLLFLAALILPTLFKDDIEAMAVEQIHQRVDAEVDFEDVRLSLLRDFPHISLIIDEFRIVGVGKFEGRELLAGERLSVSLNLFSVLSKSRPLQMVSVSLLRPRAHLMILNDGSANYDIFKPGPDSLATDAGTESGLVIDLKGYRIAQGSLTYDDRPGGTYLSLRGLDHGGSGNFSGVVFDLDTETRVDTAILRQGGITYLQGATLDWDAVLHIDNESKKFTFKDNLLVVNAFPIQIDGYVQAGESEMDLDLSLRSPESRFRDFVSLVPNVYRSSFDEMEAEGRFSFDASVKGIYRAEPETFPSFRLKLNVDDGSMRFPDLALPIENIDLDALVENPGDALDDIQVRLPRFSVQVGGETFAGSLFLQTPVSDPALQAEIQGVIDLDAWNRAFPLEEIEELGGRVTADLEVDSRQSWVEAGDYEKITGRGQVELEQLRYRSGEYPPVVVENALLKLDPRRLAIQEFKAELGSSDLQVSGSLDNLLAFIAPEKTMSGNLTLRSNLLDLNEWYDPEVQTTSGTVMDTTRARTGEEIFDRFRLSLDARANRILFDTLAFFGTELRGELAPDRIDLSSLATGWGESDLQASGRVEHLFDYLYGNGFLMADIQLRSDYMDLNAFMADGGEVPEADSVGSLSPILLPEQVLARGSFSGKRMHYGKLDLEDVEATLLLEDRNLSIEQATASTLDGRLSLEGAYDTRDALDPRFNLKLDLSQMDFQRSFSTLNTFAALAPVGRFVDGTFNASLIMEGSLEPDMMPDLNSLNAKGFLETIQGVIRGFQPIEALGDKLNLPILTDDWQITDTRNWFEVKEGQVRVQPFDVQVQGIPMTISGYHGLTNRQMDYDIEATIPRKLLAQSGLGAAADQGLSFLERQAARLGFDVKPGGDLKVGINLTGSMRQPQVGLDLLGTGPSAEPQQDSPAPDSGGGGFALPGRDSLAQLGDSAAKALGEQGQELLDSLARDPAGALEEWLDSNSVEDIRKELERWNPFRKKSQTPKQEGNNNSSNN